MPVFFGLPLDYRVQAVDQGLGELGVKWPEHCPARLVLVAPPHHIGWRSFPQLDMTILGHLGSDNGAIAIGAQVAHVNGSVQIDIGHGSPLDQH